MLIVEAGNSVELNEFLPKSISTECALNECARPTRPRLTSLELGRALAAVYVFAFHCQFLLGDTNLWGPIAFLLSFGPQAVIFFFTLSGTVIRFSIDASPKSPASFIQGRCIRLFPIYALVVIASAGLDAALFGRAIGGGLFGHFAFLQTQQGFLFSAFKSNPALWSMSYEAWFYALFSVALATTRTRFLIGWALLSLLAVVCESAIRMDGWTAQVVYVFGYSAAWLAGYFAVDLAKVVRFDRFSAVWVMALVPACASVVTPIDSPQSVLFTSLLFLPWYVEQIRGKQENDDPAKIGPYCGGVLGVLLLFAMVLCKMPAQRIAARVLIPVISVACVPVGYWVASRILGKYGHIVELCGRCSYALYVVHMPIIRMASRLLIPVWAQFLVAIIGVAVCVAVLEFAFQPPAAAMIRRMFPLVGGARNRVHCGK